MPSYFKTLAVALMVLQPISLANAMAHPNNQTPLMATNEPITTSVPSNINFLNATYAKDKEAGRFLVEGEECDEKCVELMEKNLSEIIMMMDKLEAETLKVTTELAKEFFPDTGRYENESCEKLRIKLEMVFNALYAAIALYNDNWEE